MVNDAELIVAGHTADVRDRFGVCVYDESWHQGVVGIVAGRMREKFHRPVIAFAEAGDLAPDELKGSARSLPELHIRDVLDAIAARYPGMLEKFGGHAMAAGLSLKRVHYDRFAKAFDEQVRRVLPVAALQPSITTDGALDDEEFSLEVARLLQESGPWGQGFPEPQFCGDFQVVSQRVVGEHHLKLVLKRGDRLFDAIAFRQAPLVDPGLVSAVFRLSENDYRDLPTLQLVVEHVAALA
jgi:single-stranded-DNA-specific exonuclease